jgi:hypothetical protein
MEAGAEREHLSCVQSAPVKDIRGIESECNTRASPPPAFIGGHCLLQGPSYCWEVDIDVTLHQEEVSSLLSELTPVRIHLTAGDEDRRFIELEPASEVSFVPGQGVRIVTRGRVRHELAGVGLPFDLRRLQILFSPEIVLGQHGQRLDFKLQVEQADLENVPGLVEAVVINKVNQALDPERLHMYWEIAQVLTLALPLPERFEPLNRFLMAARSVQMTVTHDSLLLRASVALSLTRTRTRPSDSGPSAPGPA